MLVVHELKFNISVFTYMYIIYVYIYYYSLNYVGYSVVGGDVHVIMVRGQGSR